MDRVTALTYLGNLGLLLPRISGQRRQPQKKGRSGTQGRGEIFFRLPEPTCTNTV